MPKKELIAMLLAGGKGSRLGTLTKNIAKPAVPFGGKYRIIDFSLSNCTNSGIDTVGILTQYKPFLLNSYIGVGSAWDLDTKKGGVYVLPPYENEKGGEWYKGTANAIYQNIEFIEQYDPEYMLIISGDHIYQMDYAQMLEFHKEKNSDGTIAVIEVPWQEASRFGIMNTDQEGRITEFAEKPKIPKSNLASMGIYIFTWKVIKKFLHMDEQDISSDNDFGKNIIPKMLRMQKKMYAYKFNGYWRDVGTIESYYEANMDLLDTSSGLVIDDPIWPIYSVSSIYPPQFIGDKAKIQNSLITEGCQIYGEVYNSILFPGVIVGKGAVIKNSIVMSKVNIGGYSIISKSIIDEDAQIGESSKIGAGLIADSLLETAEITVIEKGGNIPRGSIISNSLVGHYA